MDGKSSANSERLRCGEIFYENGKLIIECFICELIFDYNQTIFLNHLLEHSDVTPDDTKHEYLNQFEINSIEISKKNDEIYSIETKPINDNNSNYSDDDDDIELSKFNENNFFHCPINYCKQYLENRIEIIAHLLTQHYMMIEMDGRYKCGICDLELNAKGSLRSHLRIKHGILQTLTFEYNDEGKYKCPEPQCGLICYRPENLSVHIKRKHPNAFNRLLLINTIKYQENGNFDDNYKDLKKNQKRKYHDVKFSQVDNMWHCPDCDIAKSNRKLILKHVRNYHVNNTKCKICNRMFLSANSLYEHLKTHFEYKYKCNYCQKKFANQSNFDAHVRIHLGDKRYKCNYCEKRYIQCSERKLHEKIWHLKDKDHQCVICGQGFYTKTKLKYHMQRHTGEKPFECQTCNKTFYFNANLKHHVLTHSNDMPFECDTCEYKFKTKKKLLKHKCEIEIIAVDVDDESE